MDMNEIQAFVAVARAGSFTGAGKQLRAPKSTLSRQVSRLEERLGVQLLHRTTRRLGLTEAGQGYFARCLHAIEEIEDAERFALDLTESPRGLLKIATSSDMATFYLAPLLREFHERYPDVELDIEMSQRKVDLVEEGFDVAVRGGVLKDSSLIARKVARSTLVLAAAPRYLETHGRPPTLAALADHRGLMLRQIKQVMPELRLQGPVGFEPAPLEPWLTASEFEVLRRATVAGLGIGLLERNMIEPSIRCGELEIVLPGYNLGDGGGMFFVYPATHHLTPKVRAFVDFFTEKLQPIFAHDSAAQP
jgi:DNA-binding transcriptional LysR family regulator